MSDEDNSIWAIIIIILIIWGGFKVFGWIFSNDSGSSNYSTSSYSSDNSDLCVEPENPYNYDSGHYAGYEWGENGNSCSGNSSSFIEGCEEYDDQQAAFEECLSNR